MIEFNEIDSIFEWIIEFETRELAEENVWFATDNLTHLEKQIEEEHEVMERAQNAGPRIYNNRKG